ncbi:UBR1-like ring finger related treble clef, partial [Cryptosporidium canis]
VEGDSVAQYNGFPLVHHKSRVNLSVRHLDLERSRRSRRLGRSRRHGSSRRSRRLGNSERFESLETPEESERSGNQDEEGSERSGNQEEEGSERSGSSRSSEEGSERSGNQEEEGPERSGNQEEERSGNQEEEGPERSGNQEEEESGRSRSSRSSEDGSEESGRAERRRLSVRFGGFELCGGSDVYEWSGVPESQERPRSSDASGESESGGGSLPVSFGGSEIGRRSRSSERYRRSTGFTSKSSIHTLSSYYEEDKNIVQYNLDEQIYHLTNLTCPYCNTLSNLIIPFRYDRKFKKKRNRVAREDPSSNQVKEEEDLTRVLAGLQALQSRDFLADMLRGVWESDYCLGDVEVPIRKAAILQQTLPLLTLFQDLLPFNIIGDRFFINGIPSVNPMSFLIKIISDNVVFDVISGSDRCTDSSDDTGTLSSSPRDLMYEIIMDSMRTIIGRFPHMAISMICNIFPIFQSQNKMDIWSFISLQSPTARFQILTGLVIMVDVIRQIGRRRSRRSPRSVASSREASRTDSPTGVDQGKQEVGTAGAKEESSDKKAPIEDGSEQRSLAQDQWALRVLHILLTMLVLEIFSIVWTFWNPDWDQDPRVSQISNPLVRVILSRRKDRTDQRNPRPDESEAFSFFQGLVNGDSFRMDQRRDPDTGDVEYRTRKIDNLLDQRISLNIFGSLPIQITPAVDNLFASEYEGSESVYSFIAGERGATGAEQWTMIGGYPRFTLSSETGSLQQDGVPEQDSAEMKDRRVESFRVRDIQNLKDIVNLGIINWLRLVIRFQNVYIEERDGYPSVRVGETKMGTESSLEEQVSALLEQISTRLCVSVGTLELAWRVLTVFSTHNDSQRPGEHEMMSSLLTSILERNLFIKLVSRKKVLIPLSSLEAVAIQDQSCEASRLLFNINAGSFYKTVSLEEFGLLKESILGSGDKFILINQESQNIVIHNGFNNPTILLPKAFHTIYNKLLSSPIKHSNRRCCNSINNLLICISCGYILCTEYDCCNESEHITKLSSRILDSHFYCYSGEGVRQNEDTLYSYSIPFGTGLQVCATSIPLRNHTTICGKGLSFFLHVSSSVILSFRLDLSSTRNENDNVFNWIEADRLFLYGGRGCEFSTLYVDEYGEEDRHLIRGKPMIMCKYRWMRLQGFAERHRVRRNTKLAWSSFQPFEFQQTS